MLKLLKEKYLDISYNSYYTDIIFMFYIKLFDKNYDFALD